MLPETQTQTHFALEGFLPLWLLAVLGVVLLGAIVWLARVDRRAVDRAWPARIFPALRLVAVLVLLWILAGPTRVTTTQQYRTKTVAFLLDRSASMGLVDISDGSGNVARWDAVQPNAAPSPLADLDAAVSALRVHENQLRRLAASPDTLSSSTEVESSRAILNRAAAALPKSASAISDLAARAPAPDPGWQRSIRDALLTLESNVTPTVQSKATEFSRGKTLAAIDRAAWLPEVLRHLADATGRLELLADRLAKSVDSSHRPGAAAASANSESRLTRSERIEHMLVNAEKSWLQELRKKVRVQRYEFGDRVVPQGSSLFETRPGAPASTQPMAGSTQLGLPLEQLAVDASAQSVAAAFILTDGGHNAGRDPREVAPSLSGTPTYFLPIGNTKMQRDVILHHTHAPKAVFQGDQVVVDSMVTAYDCAQETLQAELVDNDRVVDRQTLQVSSEVYDTRVQLRWKAARLGKQALTFRIVPVGNERSQENNLAKTDVLVMEDKIRVLVADNFPRWETRYLINLFKRDTRVVFEQLLFEPQRTAGDGARHAFPATLEEWNQYRVVILGDLLPSQLTAADQKNLRDYVSQSGGNLVLVAGKDAMPAAYVNQTLGSLLPVLPGERPLGNETPYFLQLSDEGTLSLATQIAENPQVSERQWREMSERLPIYSLSDFSRLKPTSHSLIWATTSTTSREGRPKEGDLRSYLAWHYVGAGRVVYLAAPVSYQLRYRQGDTFHHRFWGQLLRWTIARDLGEGSQTIRITTDKSRYEAGERVESWVRLRHLDGRAPSGATLQLTASQDGRVLQEISLREDKERPGMYQGAFLDLPVGPVQLAASGPVVKSLMAEEKLSKPVEATIHMDPGGSTELRHPLCNLPLLREIADASSGALLPPAGLKAALEQLDLDPQVTELTSKMPLWNRWDLFWVFIVCLSLEWAGRKYVGLS
ncbi:MAG: hypothetical protein JNK85_02160 [Verrucomicrobiales bacterium]|nr:hypothetical protein [Verrucomicrobiales bacterium]